MYSNGRSTFVIFCHLLRPKYFTSAFLSAWRNAYPNILLLKKIKKVFYLFFYLYIYPPDSQESDQGVNT